MPRIIAGHVDAIVFVTVWRRTPKALARQAMKSLGANAGKVVGALVNQVEHDTLEHEWASIGRPFIKTGSGAGMQSAA